MVKSEKVLKGKMGRAIFNFLLLLAIILLSATSSYAATKTLRPCPFNVWDSANGDRIRPDFLCSTSSSAAQFSAVFKLPVGSVIRKVSYYHYGTVSGAITMLWIYRKKLGEEKELLVSHGQTGAGRLLIEKLSNTINLARVKSGYTYWVELYSADYNSRIEGVKISYRLP